MSVYLVAGGSGYFGSILVQYLVNKGQKVRIFDLNDNTDRSNTIECVRGDIRNSKDVLKALHNVDIVYNTIAQVPLSKNKELFNSVNILGLKILLDTALQLKIKKVIHLSSSAVYGIPESNPVNDSVQPRPLEAYGKSKYEAEKIASQYIKKGLDITIIRPRTILGHIGQ